jgi:beta-glucuronidase
VPSCWESYPGFGAFRGKAAYETTFEGGGNLRVVCKGVSHTAAVFVDGREIARHYNAYTAFSGIVRAAEKTMHSLRIEVSNEFSEESALHVPNDYMSYGGVTRPVIIEELPDVFIEWVHATPEYAGGVWSLTIETGLRNIGAVERKAALRHTLSGRNCCPEAHMVPANSSAVIKAHCDYPGVKPYNLDAPELYELETLLYLDKEQEPADDLIERVGFRTAQVRGKEILLNGMAIRIKGVCRHEDHPQFGCALPFQAMDYDLNQIKAMGANAIRTCHYPNDELFLDLCDEKGILVWEENHARGLTESQMRNPNFKRQCSDCTREMVSEHFNHPSIIIWGILNECASETEYGKECYAEQFAIIKEMDSSRPTSFASCKFFTDLCLGLPDIVGYNIYPEWYTYPEWPKDNSTAAMMSQIYEWIQNTEGTGKPFLITEIGAGAFWGNRSPHRAKWSEERQAETLSRQLEYVMAQAYCSGVFIWQYCDVRVSEEWFDRRPREMNNKGLVDEYRRPKLAYDVVKEIYGLHGNHK